MTNENRDRLITETYTLTKQTHTAVFGNGKPGLKVEFERVRGIVYFMAFVIPVIIGIHEIFCK